jgi:hypothetical protein
VFSRLVPYIVRLGRSLQAEISSILPRPSDHPPFELAKKGLRPCPSSAKRCYARVS